MEGPSMLVASVLPCVGSQVWLLKNPFSDPFGPVKVCSNMFGCVFVVQVHISSHQKSDKPRLLPGGGGTPKKIKQNAGA